MSHLRIDPGLKEHEIPDSVTYMTLSDMMNKTELPITKGLKLMAYDELPVAKGRFGWDLFTNKTVVVLHYRLPKRPIAIFRTIIVK